MLESVSQLVFNFRIARAFQPEHGVVDICRQDCPCALFVETHRIEIAAAATDEAGERVCDLVGLHLPVLSEDEDGCAVTQIPGQRVDCEAHLKISRDHQHLTACRAVLVRWTNTDGLGPNRRERSDAEHERCMEAEAPSPVDADHRLPICFLASFT